MTLCLVSFGLVVLLLLLFLLRPMHHSLPEHSIVARIRDAAYIGYALSRYRSDHNGLLPVHLSELVPKYIEPAKINYFFSGRRNGLGVKDSTVSASLLREIDDSGAFVYVAERGFQEDLVLYEHSDQEFKDQDKTNIVTLTTNFIPKLRSARDVGDRIAHLK
jgi:hypothetical protein